MRYFYTFLLLLFLGSTQTAIAQDTIRIGQFYAKKMGGRAILRGIVSNPETGEPLVGASLIVSEINVGTTTGEDGSYGIILPLGIHKLQATYLGLEPITKYIEIYDDGVVDFGLSKQAYSLREVVVQATIDDKNVRNTSAGVTQLQVKDIKALPTFLGEVDVVKSLMMLPGVSTVGEGASGFNVRGGRIDQNLVQLNGGALFNASHVLGFFSAFNPDVIDQFTLYKGHVPAQFGGRAASVLDIVVRDGNFEEYEVKGGIGLIASRIAAEGPIIKDKTSFLVGARASYSDWLLGLVKEPNVRNSSAAFNDLNLILSHRFNFNHRVSISYYGSSDRFRYAQDFGFEYGSQLLSARWNGILSNQLSTSSTLTAGDYRSASFLPQGQQAFTLDNGIRYYQFKQNFFYVPDQHTINFGLEANMNQMKPDALNPRGATSIVLPKTVERDQSRDLALYFNDEIQLSDRFSINAGLRYSLFQQTGADQIFTYANEQLREVQEITDTLQYASGEVIQSYGGLEPRIGLRLGLDENNAGAIKMSYNRARQYIHLISNSTAPTPVDIWQVSNPYLPPQIADNFSIGYFRNFNKNVFESYIEFYYKHIDNLVDYQDFPELLLNNHIETDLVSGLGRAYGMEIYFRRKAGRWTGWVSYAYSRSEIRIPVAASKVPINQGDWYPTSFDQPHAVNLIAKRQLGRRSFLSFNFTYRTGRPITGLVATYEQNRSAIPHFSERNQYRIPDYWRLDASLLIAGKEWPGKKYKWDLSLSVYNLFGRQNAFSVFYERPEGILVPKAFQLAILGAAFPSVTYNFSF